MLSRIANFDDFDPLRDEPAVDLRFVAPGEPLPPADLVILPGTKSTIADLAFFRAQRWHVDLETHMRRGGHILGICGGYQMLGRRIHDPEGIDGAPGSVDALGLLDVETVMRPEKRLALISGQTVGDGVPFNGYEMHVGETHGPDRERPLLQFADGRMDGAISADGRISGCYLHGLFADTRQRDAWLTRLGTRSSGVDHGRAIDQALDDLAAALATHVDIAALAQIAGL